MRFIIYILLSLLIVSCGTTKLNRDKIKLPDDIELDGVPDFIDSTSVYPDTDGDGIDDSKDMCPTMAGLESNDGCPAIEMVISESIRYESNETRGEEFEYQKPRVKKPYIQDVEKMDIVDNTSQDTSSTKGTIAYSVPNEMQVGKQYVIKLRITKQKGKEVNQTLVLGDRNIPISDVNIESKVTIENIRVEKTMTAQLISQDGNFKITPQNTDKQIVEDSEYTEWGWIVTPLKSGRAYLKLIIKIKIDNSGEIIYKDIVVFDKDIQVRANATFEVKNWLSQYWQWLMTTIIIPLVVWFFKRKKKKGEEVGEEETEE